VGPAESGIKPWNEPATDAATVREALFFALRFNGPEYMPESGYATGEKAYQTWEQALREARALDHGHRYNAAVWSECRAHRVEFLREAKERLKGLVAAGRLGVHREIGQHIPAVPGHCRLQIPLPVARISRQSTQHSLVGIGVQEDAVIHQLPEPLIAQHQMPLPDANPPALPNTIGLGTILFLAFWFWSAGG
jgi:hypothetical protein